ncbi:hypothetical protein V6N11_005024 [Hibiscus sabdariffa]|uniref:DUF4283 domain-containing protein n=1 Tax=Hibiscus sabdariffa TaxID=183260 RepID=A0ABR2NHX1_9ROSI
MILYQVQQSEPKFQASRLFDFNSWVMFPYPPPSSDELLRSSNIRSPDSMAPPAVPSVRVLGSPRPVDDQQAVKRGKTLATVDTIDTSKGMEIHNHPQASYAGIVSESGRQVASNTVPSLDDVIVESGDVIVDKTGLFPSGAFQVVDLANDYYLVMFENEFDYEHVLTGGSWTVFGSYVTVQPWSREFSTTESFPAQIMVWVRIPSLLYQYYSRALFRQIVGVKGRVMQIDYNTNASDRGRFARLAVMISLKSPLVSGVKINGTVYRLEYEGLQRICFSFSLYGHSSEVCTKGSVVDGHREELLSDATVAVPSTSEEEVYGPWMHANTRHWQPRKDVGRSKGMASRDAGDHERAAKAVLRGTGASLPELPVISVAFDGDRRISDEAGLKVVNGNFQEPIPVVSSMGNQAPQVVSHVVQNVADWLSSGSDHMGIGSVGTRVSANQSNVVIDIKEGTKRGVGIGSFEATASDIDRGTFTVSGAMKMSTLDPDLGRENNEVLTATAVTDTTSTSRRS